MSQESNHHHFHLVPSRANSKRCNQDCYSWVKTTCSFSTCEVFRDRWCRVSLRSRRESERNDGQGSGWSSCPVSLASRPPRNFEECPASHVTFSLATSHEWRAVTGNRRDLHLNERHVLLEADRSASRAKSTKRQTKMLSKTWLTWRRKVKHHKLSSTRENTDTIARRQKPWDVQSASAKRPCFFLSRNDASHVNFHPAAIGSEA